jgi:uncharacterized membrane protein YedE/YeeE
MEFVAMLGFQKDLLSPHLPLWSVRASLYIWCAMSFKNTSFKLILSAFASGLVFGFGLILAGMTNPSKVLAFLDVTGQWDPTLAFVMAGALLTLGLLQWRIQKKYRHHLTPVNSKSNIDSKLLLGAAIFGIGWGLSGLCPGPALVSLSSQLTGSYVFFLALIAGIFLFKITDR